jgi:hypothetical protein
MTEEIKTLKEDIQSLRTLVLKQGLMIKKM